MDKSKLPPNGFFEPGKTYRFRTLVHNAISMGRLAGTEFSVVVGDGRVVFAGQNRCSGMSCSSPRYWIDAGHIEWVPDVYGNEED